MSDDDVPITIHNGWQQCRAGDLLITTYPHPEPDDALTKTMLRITYVPTSWTVDIDMSKDSWLKDREEALDLLAQKIKEAAEGAKDE